MIACVDVDYREPGAVAACVLFRGWSDELPAGEETVRIDRVAPYEPGQFYKRELPCLLGVLHPILARQPLEAIVVDGYVWLRDEEAPGGAHLYQALGRALPVIGVAKTRFVSAVASVGVVRGDSQKPLFVTAAGVPVELAAAQVKSMHGPYRIPTLLKRVDWLCRNT